MDLFRPFQSSDPDPRIDEGFRCQGSPSDVPGSTECSMGVGAVRLMGSRQNVEPHFMEFFGSYGHVGSSPLAPKEIDPGEEEMFCEDCTEIPETFVHTVLPEPLPSSLRQSARANRPCKRVRFGTAISFWFPAEQQVHLCTRAHDNRCPRHVGFRQGDIPFLPVPCYPLHEVSHVGLRPPPPIHGETFKWDLTASASQKDSAVGGPFQADRPTTSLAEHVGLRSPLPSHARNDGVSPLRHHALHHDAPAFQGAPFLQPTPPGNPGGGAHVPAAYHLPLPSASFADFEIFQDPECLTDQGENPFKGGSCRTLADSRRPCARSPSSAKDIPFEHAFTAAAFPALTRQALGDVTNLDSAQPADPGVGDISAEHVGFRSPPLQQEALSVLCKGLPTSKHGPDTQPGSCAPDLTAVHHSPSWKLRGVDAFPKTLPPAVLHGPRPKRVFRPAGRIGHSPYSPPEAPREDTHSALTPGLLPIPHHGLPQPFARPGRFTSFDVLDQARSFTRGPDWDLQRCLFEAVSASAIPGPVGRRLQYPVYGFDEPQFVIHRSDRRFTHKSVVFLCPSAVPHFWVCDVPNGVSLQTFLFETVSDNSHPWFRAFASWPTFSCLVNGAPVECFRPVPARADVIDILLGPHFDYRELVAAAPAEGRTRPPTPPIPMQRWERRRLREPPSSSTSIEEVSTEPRGVASDPDTFVVFDVFYHARVLPCQRHHSVAHRAAIALEHTPQISSEVTGFREVRFRLPGFPPSQIVLWGDKLPDSVILPVALGTGPSSICTVESPLAYSALQLVTLLCRYCQLPDHIIEAISELDARVLINEAPVYPLDPDVCRGADTAMLQGVLYRPTLQLATPSPFSAAPPSQDEADSALAFVQPLSATEPGTAEFTVFAVGAAPCVLPIPDGASMADLVDLAFREFPALGPRCGHRLPTRSLPGFPPIQFCIWGTTGIDDRVILIVLPDQGGVRTVRAPRSSSPVQLLQLAGCSDFSEGIQNRQLHVVAGGRPCQPNDPFVVQAFDTIRIVRGPPPVRAQGAHLRRWAQPPPSSLPCIPTCQVSDEEANGTLYIHRIGEAPTVLPIPHTLRAIQASGFAVAVVGGEPHALLRFPLASPLAAGTMPHAVLATRPPTTGHGFAIVDLRRVLRPPLAPFVTIAVPSIITQSVVIERLGSIASHMRAAASFYIDGELLGSGASTVSMACTITLFGYNAFPFPDHASPALLDTVDALSVRGGFRSFFFRPRGLATSTSTTTVPWYPPSAASSSSPPGLRIGGLDTTQEASQATNPALLDFLRDERAIDRVEVNQRQEAYTLFDSVLQTRLVAKQRNWDYLDCLADARRHFLHLGPDPELRVIRDAINGLPNPQIAATPRTVCHRVAAFPVDVRPAGRGICVLDIPQLATPFSIAYQAASACQMHGLHQQIARRDCLMRCQGRDLSPHDTLADADSATVWFSGTIPRMSLASQFIVQEAMREALREARDLQHSFFEHGDPVPVMIHVPDHPPLQVFIPKECSSELLHELASDALSYFTPHRRLRLHLPGGFPRGTDCMLHFVAEMDDCLEGDRTFYLIDGRPLEPSGPPFRTLNLPARLALGELYGLVRQTFMDASPAAFIRVNRCLLHRLTLQRFRLPVLRPLQLGAVNALPTERDDSLVPSIDVLEGFPGLWVSHFGSDTTTSTTWGAASGGHGHSTATTTSMPAARVRSFLFPAGFSFQDGDCFPWHLQLPKLFPEQRVDEVLIHSFGWGTFRVWVPFPSTAATLQSQVADALNLPSVNLCWPPMAPCEPGNPLHLVIWPSDLSCDGVVAIVDARRVGPPCGEPFWLRVLSDEETAESLVATAISGRQLCITPAGVRVDGFRPTSGYRPRPGVRVLTLLSGAEKEHWCVAINEDPFSRFPGTRSFPLTPRHPPPTSTTTTSFPAPRPRRCIDPLVGIFSQQLRVHIVGDNYAVAHTTLDGRGLAADLLTVLLWCLERNGALAAGVTITACPRVFFDCDQRPHLFLSARPPGSARPVWLFSPEWSEQPWCIPWSPQHEVPDILDQLEMPPAASAVISVNGEVCREHPAFTAPGHVIMAASSVHLHFTLPLHLLADRCIGAQALLFRSRGPGARDLATQQALRHFCFHLVEHARCLLGEHTPGNRCIIAGTRIPPLLCCAGTLLPPSLTQVQSFYDSHLLPHFGAMRLRDTACVEYDLTYFVERQDAVDRRIWLLPLEGGADALFGDISGCCLAEVPTPLGRRLEASVCAGWVGISRLQPVQFAGQSPITVHARPPPGLSSSSGSSPTDSQTCRPQRSLTCEEERMLARWARRSRFSDNPYPESCCPPSGYQQHTIEVDSVGGSASDSTEGLSISEEDTGAATSSGLPREPTAPPPPGEGISLLQLGATKIRVFQPEHSPHIIAARPGATVGEVLDQLPARPGTAPLQFVPVFPQTGPVFECVAFSPDYAPGCIPVLFDIWDHCPLVVFLSSNSTCDSLRDALRLHDGLFEFGGRPWHGPSSGCIPGMRITAACSGHVRHNHPATWAAVGETIPQSAPEHPLCGARNALEADAACTPVALPRLIPTPLRNRRQTVTLRLSELIVPAGPAFAIGVDSSMLDFCLEGHLLSGLGISLPDTARIGCRLRILWESLPLFCGTPLDEAFIFSDGSYDPHHTTAGWAVVILGLRDGKIGKVGFAHGQACQHQPACNAFHAELEALLHAHAFATHITAGRIHFGVDCSAALLVGNGIAATSPEDLVGRACLGLQLASGTHTPRLQHKVTAHAQCLPNELADGLAKASVFEGYSHPPVSHFEAFWSAVQERVFDWLWVARQPSSSGLPFLTPEGSWSTAACAAPTSTHPATLGMTVTTGTSSQPFAFDLRVMQYNCLSMRGQAALELMAQSLQAQRVAIAGFQETRRRESGIRREGRYWVISAPCQANGQLGCQIWLDASAPLAVKGRPCHWDRKSFLIFKETPRMLILTADAAPFRFALAAAHAPTSKAPPEQITAFWSQLSAALGCLPRSCNVILCIDANARFTQERQEVDTLKSYPLCPNAEHLQQLCSQHQLAISCQFTASGARLHSWTSPSGNKSLIDYVAVPMEWGGAFHTLDSPTLVDLHSGIDHEPILVRCRPVLEGARTRSRKQPNWRALATPEGQSALRDAWASMPVIGWDVDATTHVACIHQHLLDSMLRGLPPEENRPRNPVLTGDTLAIIKYRRHLRRCERSARQTMMREFLHLCFRSWHAAIYTMPPAPDRALRSASRNCRWWHARVLKANEDVTAATAKDRAAFFRRMMREHRDAGPSKFAHHIRALTRQGRKFKPAHVLRSLDGTGGAVTDHRALHDSLGRHFAVAELAVEVDTPTALSHFDHRGPPDSLLQAADMPSLSDLASGFAQLQSNRAPGLSGLVPEVFRLQPVLAALVNFPVVLKSFARGHVPAQWAGGLAATVPKPGKDARSPDGWRAILLLESDAKAIQKAVRPQLLDTMRVGRAPAQFGGIPGYSLTIPSAVLRAHLLRLHNEHVCGGAVFVDVRTAYYSVLRDLLSASDAERCDDAWVQARANFLFKDPRLQSEFIDKLRTYNPLREFGASAATLRYVQAQLGQTWFAARPDSNTVFQTGTGTAPGSPIADTLFATVFRDFLMSVQDFLDLKGLSARVCLPDTSGSSTKEYTVPMPTWADDTCILFQTPNADAVNQAIADIAEATQRLLAPIRLLPNFCAGKTEAMAVYHGGGARRARQATLCANEPVIEFRNPAGGPSYIRVVPQYPHLGTLVRSDLHEIPNLRARESHMLAMFRPLRRRVLTCPELSVAEKAELIRSRVFPRFLHQAGLWRLGTAAEARIAHEALRKVSRSAFKPLLGRSSQGFSNEEVAAGLCLPMAEELLDVERCRSLREIVLSLDPFVWHTYQQDGVWMSHAVNATCRILRACHPSLLSVPNATADQLAVVIRQFPQAVKTACKAYLKHCIGQREGIRLRLLQAPEKGSVVRISDSEEDVPLSRLGGMHTCEVCKASFRTKQQLGLHRARAHKLLAPHTSLAVGTMCQVCLKEYWTLQRLQAHLKKNPSCQRIYFHADLDAETRSTPHSSDPCRAWRPVCVAEGPQPFWATLDPMG